MVNTIFLVLDLLMIIYWAHEWGQTKEKFPLFMSIFMSVGLVCAHLSSL